MFSVHKLGEADAETHYMGTKQKNWSLISLQFMQPILANEIGYRNFYEWLEHQYQRSQGTE